MMPVGAVEQKPCRLDRRGAQHDDFSKHFKRLLCDLIDAGDSLRLAGLFVHDDVTRHRVWSEREPAGLLGGGQRRSRTAEVRPRRTAAIAMPAVVTAGPAVVLLSENRGPSDDDVAVLPLSFDCLLQKPFAAGHLHPRQKTSVGQIRNAVLIPAHAYELLYSIVVRSEVRVRDRPVLPVAVTACRLELPIRESIGLPAPCDRTPANLPPSDPVKPPSLRC